MIYGVSNNSKSPVNSKKAEQLGLHIYDDAERFTKDPEERKVMT